MIAPLAPVPSDDAVIASIRTNVVFEKMIVSVLTVSVVAGAVHLVVGVGAIIAGAALSLPGVMNAVIAAASFAALFFISGFAAAAAVGIPLYRRLEKAKLRKAWPYYLVAFAVSFLILAILGAAPSVEAPAQALYLLPGLAAAFVFARKMRPFWRAAERAETAPTVVRLQ